MKKFAVIDVGSNSVRLLFVADGTLLYKRLQTTRLGEGIAQMPRLLPEAIARTANAVANFYRQALEEGAEEVLAFATAAVRTAENRKEFLDAVQALCGLQIEVLSGEEEAEIGLLGALGNADGGVLDIGGASTELVLRSNGKITYKKSVDIGVVRLKDSCGQAYSALQKRALEGVKLFVSPTIEMQIYAIGGTATTIAAQLLGLKEYDSAAVTGSRFTRTQIQELCNKLARMSVAEIAALPCMPTGRADVIFGGVVWLATLMQELGISQITVSDRDNLEGYAIKKGKRFQ